MIAGKSVSTREEMQNSDAPTSLSGRDAPAPAIEPVALPTTVAQARDYAHSDGAKALIDLAAAIAAEVPTTHSQLGPIELFLALMLDGERRAHVDSASRWLHEWALEKTELADDLLLPFRSVKPTPVHGSMPLTPQAGAIIARAVMLAQLTVKRNGFDLRHLAAALTLPDKSNSNIEVCNYLKEKLETDAVEFIHEITKRIAKSKERGESLKAWKTLIDTPIDAPSFSDTKQFEFHNVITVSGFHADRAFALGGDPLGINADVEAFARLICLEDARPPLSIGVFGEWGSGKSSFMERLQLAIAELTIGERKRAKGRQPNGAVSSGNNPATAPRFIENVVQIRFNAWHYADANLWASLTAEFFDQLRRGGHEGQRSSDYLALIGKVADRVRSLEASSQQAQLALTDAEHAARDANEALAGAHRKLAASDLALASEHLAKALQDIRSDKDNAEKLKEVGRRVYRDDLGKDADAFSAAAAEASTIAGKAALIARLVAGGGWPTRLALLATALVAIAGIGLRLGNPGELAVLAQRLIAWGGGIAAATASVWQAVKLAKPVLDGAWAYAKAVETARKTLAKEVEVKEAEARKAAFDLAKARETAEKAKAPLAKYGEGASAGAPGTILRYFLFEDSDVRDYDKQVGLVSRARRSFEQLDAIFGANRDGLAAKRKQARLKPDETLDPKEVEALKRFEAMQLDKQGLVIPDRIVLYIDDLDRCTHQQVYDVLQAIHLLLAFELFVVVVGVDVRWVEEAVARQFTITTEDLPDSATPAEREVARHKAETERRKRAIDYLEKIFQLPFWLRRLSTEGNTGGSYGAYVQELLRANLEVPQTIQSPLAGTSGGPILKTLASGTTPDAASPPAEDVAVKGLADTAPAADDLASVELALATVRLTKEEVDFLASPEIGAIAFKSPRSVKRMLNVYRIVRARMSEAELDEFLGKSGKVATWPIAVFFAAVETSQPVEIADALYRAVKTIPPYERFDTLDAGAIVSSTKKTLDTADGYEAIMLADEATNHAISLATKAIEQMMSEDNESDRRPVISDMLAMARIVRRYSFNRYH